MVVDDVDVAYATRQWPVLALRAREHGIRALYACSLRAAPAGGPPSSSRSYRDRAGPGGTGVRRGPRNRPGTTRSPGLLLLSSPAPSLVPSPVPSLESDEESRRKPGSRRRTR
ncbi:hypothetical protein [Streptomyces sp. NRRL S-1521]|uniref:hypothetical protein n=1 Tax=Streptomyces sp. NRRL S-1521 TaxID=1609100 RepID=UPI00131C63CD|nr:hypothetical protein [Streptomyces sp. NRRL S-1521]